MIMMKNIYLLVLSAATVHPALVATTDLVISLHSHWVGYRAKKVSGKKIKSSTS
ncbi:hypothetical protein D3C85_861490 [compost metagenome]